MSDDQRVNWDDIMKRLAGIKALADRGGTLAEAEAASAMMAKLLLRYSLTRLDVERHATESGRAVTTEDITTGAANWKRILLTGVACGHFCRAVCDLAGTATVIGHAHNLIIVREMYLWLVDEINRLCGLAHADAVTHDEWGPALYPRSWKNNFRVSAAQAVHWNYRVMLRKAEKEATVEEWALVPAMTAEVESRVRELFPNAKKGRAPQGNWLAGGYAEGDASGAKINLNRQVGTTGKGSALTP